MATYNSTWRWFSAMVCVLALLLRLVEAPAAKPIYSYVDERGNLVATDREDTIPERYRSRVVVTESAENPQSSKSAVSSASSQIEERLVQLVNRLPATVIPNMSAYQSVILIGGALAMLFFYGAAKLTSSAFLRLLMPWAIGLLTFSTIYLMYISDLSDRVAARTSGKSSGSLIHQFQKKGKSLEEQKLQRLKDFNQKTGQE